MSTFVPSLLDLQTNKANDNSVLKIANNLSDVADAYTSGNNLQFLRAPASTLSNMIGFPNISLGGPLEYFYTLNLAVNAIITLCPANIANSPRLGQAIYFFNSNNGFTAQIDDSSNNPIVTMPSGSLYVFWLDTNSTSNGTWKYVSLIYSGSSPTLVGLNLSGLSASRLIATDSSNNLTSNVTGLSPGFTGLNLSGLSVSSLVATDASKNLVSGSLTGDITTSNLVSTLATVNSNVGTFGDGTHVAQLTVNAKGLITAASSVAISGAPPTGSAGNDLSGTYPNPIVARINGAALGVMSATSGNIPIGSGTQWVTRAVSGDATITSTGTLTVTKTNGVSFASSATTDTTNAANISSGTLPTGRLTGAYTGITALGTLTGLTMSNNTSTALFNISSTLTGSSNSVGIAISRGDAANGFADIYFKTGSTFNYEFGMQAGDSAFYFTDLVNSATIFSVSPASGINGTFAFGGIVTVINNLKITTAGKTLYIKQGSNACAGTGAVLVGGTVTISTTAVNTGDIILLNRTASGGTPGFITTSISDGVSFTLTSSSGSDTSTFSWVIIKAA